MSQKPQDRAKELNAWIDDFEDVALPTAVSRLGDAKKKFRGINEAHERILAQMAESKENTTTPAVVLSPLGEDVSTLGIALVNGQSFNLKPIKDENAKIQVSAQYLSKVTDATRELAEAEQEFSIFSKLKDLLDEMTEKLKRYGKIT